MTTQTKEIPVAEFVVSKSYLPDENKAQVDVIMGLIRKLEMMERYRNVVKYPDDYMRGFRNAVETSIDSYCYEIYQTYIEENSDGIKEGMRDSGHYSEDGLFDYAKEDFWRGYLGVSYTSCSISDLAKIFKLALEYESDWYRDNTI